MTWATEITADSPVDWWKFQSGTVTFHSGSGTLTTGIVGANDAYSYQIVTAWWGGPTTAVMQGGTAFTVYCVFKAPSTLANRTELIFQPANNSPKSIILIHSDGALGGWFGLKSDIGLISADDWVFAALSYDGVGTLKLHMNGVEVDSLSRTPAQMTADFADGSDVGPSVQMHFANGYHNPNNTGFLPDTWDSNLHITDEVVTFSSELSQTRIAAHNTELGLTPPTPADDVQLQLPVRFNNLPVAELFLPIRLRVADDVDLSLPVRLDTGDVSLSLPVRLINAGDVSLSVPIRLMTATQALANRVSARWKASVIIGGVDYSTKLTGSITIDQSENASSIATVTLLPDSGSVDASDFLGERITIDYIDTDDTGAVQYQVRRFVGVVSDPLFDAMSGELSLQCTTDMQGVLSATNRTAIDAITPDAEWSPFVFDEGAQGWEYFQDRMRTVTQSAWHSPSGIVVTDWAAKTTADFEFTDSEVFELGPYRPANRRQMLNQVNATFDFRFKRKRQRTVQVAWRTLQTWCEFLINGFTLCQRNMVEEAARGGNWDVQGGITFDPVPASGGFKCFSGTVQNWIAWVATATHDRLCWGADWFAAKRWLQDVTERYSITLTAAQSQAGNGAIVETEHYTQQCTEDPGDWASAENFDASNAAMSGFTAIDGVASEGYTLGDIGKDVTDDVDTGRTASTQTRTTLIAAASADIIGSHRQNSIPALLSFQPNVNLTHTVRFNTSVGVAKGKVSRIYDVLNIDNGDATSQVFLALSRHEGTGIVTPDPLTPNTAPAKPTETDIEKKLFLQTYVGGRTDTTALTGTERGYFTNWVYDPTDNDPFASDPNNPQTILYPEQFKIDYPDISGTAADPVELTDTQSIAVEIPVDELDLIQ